MNHRFLWVTLLASIDDNSCRKITRAHTGHTFVETWNPRTLVLQQSPECVFSCEGRVKHYWQRCFDTILIRGYISPLSLPERPPWMQASTAEAALGALGEWFQNPASGSRHARKSQACLDLMWFLLRLTLVALQSDVTFEVRREPRWLSQRWLKGPI